MADQFPVTSVAAVQAAPVFLDREASVAKACRLIAEAGAAGANLAVFGETWLPGYPIWLDVAPGAGLWNHQPAKAIFTRLVANAVEVPGPVTEALGIAAAEAGCAVVMGVSTRLMDALLTELQGYTSLKKAILDVNVEQVAAVALYRRFGFDVIGETTKPLGDGNNHDEYVMEKALG